MSSMRGPGVGIALRHVEDAVGVEREDLVPITRGDDPDRTRPR